MGLYSASVSTNPHVNAYSQQLFIPLIPISTNTPILSPHPPESSLTYWPPHTLGACFHFIPSTPACIIIMGSRKKNTKKPDFDLPEDWTQSRWQKNSTRRAPLNSAKSSRTLSRRWKSAVETKIEKDTHAANFSGIKFLNKVQALLYIVLVLYIRN